MTQRTSNTRCQRHGLVVVICNIAQYLTRNLYLSSTELEKFVNMNLIRTFAMISDSSVRTMKTVKVYMKQTVCKTAQASSPSKPEREIDFLVFTSQCYVWSPFTLSQEHLEDWKRLIKAMAPPHIIFFHCYCWSSFY